MVVLARVLFRDCPPGVLQAFERIPGRKYRDAVHLTEALHMAFVAGDNEVRSSSDGRSECGVILGVRRQVNSRQVGNEKPHSFQVVDESLDFFWGNT